MNMLSVRLARGDDGCRPADTRGCSLLLIDRPFEPLTFLAEMTPSEVAAMIMHDTSTRVASLDVFTLLWSVPGPLATIFRSGWRERSGTRLALLAAVDLHRLVLIKGGLIRPPM
jgi:hypothetical protein